MKYALLIAAFVSSMSMATTGKSQEKTTSFPVTAITEVFGEGQKVVGAIVEYPAVIRNESLAKSSFTVTGRTITNVYASATATRTGKGSDGRYVIIELSPDDKNAATFQQMGRQSAITKATVTVQQTQNITIAGNKIMPAWQETISSKDQINEVADDFKQLDFADPVTGKTIHYNLYIPKHYDKHKTYPLVLFIHDAGVVNTDVKTTLAQGLGAVIWASPAEQSKHESFVLAPQYSEVILKGESGTTPEVDATVHLLGALVKEYSIDAGRLYATGQSMGCMTTIAMNIKYPDLFAASFLVAGQWDVTQVKPLADKKMWIVVSGGDLKAFPGMNAITDTLEKAGAQISRATWNGRADAAEFDGDVKKMLSEKANIRYTVLQKGTVVPPDMRDDGGSNHICTWRIAYTIEGIRDWLFRQKKP